MTIILYACIALSIWGFYKAFLLLSGKNYSYLNRYKNVPPERLTIVAKYFGYLFISSGIFLFFVPTLIILGYLNLRLFSGLLALFAAGSHVSFYLIKRKFQLVKKW